MLAKTGERFEALVVATGLLGNDFEKAHNPVSPISVDAHTSRRVNIHVPIVPQQLTVRAKWSGQQLLFNRIGGRLTAKQWSIEGRQQ